MQIFSSSYDANELIVKLNSDLAPSLRNSFVSRNADLTNYHLRNSATDLTLPQPKRGFLKSGTMLWFQLPNEENLAESRHSFKNVIKNVSGFYILIPTYLTTYLPTKRDASLLCIDFATYGESLPLNYKVGFIF